MDYSIGGAINHWMSGNELNKSDLIVGLKVIWILRFALIIQFVAALTIIAEILGKQKIQKRIKQTESLLSFGQHLKNLWSDIMSHFLYHFFVFVRWLNNYWIAAYIDEFCRKNEIANYNIMQKRRNIFLLRKEIIDWLKSHRSYPIRAKLRMKSYKYIRMEYPLKYIMIALTIAVLGVLILNLMIAFETIQEGIEYEPLSITEHILFSVMTFLGLLFLSGIFSPILLFILQIVEFVFLSGTKFLVILPMNLYLKLSEKEKQFKLLSFLLFSIGFILSLVCS